ncbi:hypothetical protein [Planomonospora venezuelensis]|uniref:Uncharacterized protein n=1 Tax=Planomonospora venezuelensis TaxID=1999 RepID=A0A841DE47_PLAVE|nr:hypothetical protein [Planomonospora venezuelensis]MBB5967167.1 hypothetical protein [Planomonospora venezuelensis]GIN02935.1 hypothetical protein Pve01_45930 [Planomonospora venezuelensis]
MNTARALAGLSIAGIAVLAPATAHAAAGSTTGTADARSAQAAAVQWGPHYAGGRKAKASGSLTATAKDDPGKPAGRVTVTGRVTDLTRSTSTCGWAVFRVSVKNADGGVSLKQRNYRACSHGKPLAFAFSHKNVYEVELKVCAEAKASKPSLTCLYAGTWKSLYTYYA